MVLKQQLGRISPGKLVTSGPDAHVCSSGDSQLQVLPVTFEDSIKKKLNRALFSHRLSLWKLLSVFVLHSFSIWPALPLIYGQMRKRQKRKEYLTEETGT